MNRDHKSVCFDLLDEAKQLFTVRLLPTGVRVGLLVPPVDGSIFPYVCPALAFYTYIDPDGKFFACIYSKDDSGVSIYGNEHTNDVTTSKFLEFLESMEFKCPTRDELAAFCQLVGAYADYW